MRCRRWWSRPRWPWGWRSCSRPGCRSWAWGIRTRWAGGCVVGEGGGGGGDPVRGGAVVPGPGRSEPDELGADDRFEPAVRAVLLVGRGLPGRCDLRHGAGRQPDRRRPERCAEPQVEGTLMSADALLRVQDLHVEFNTRRGQALVLGGVDFEIRTGETLCVV